MEVQRDVHVNLVTPTDPVEGTVVENRRLTDDSSPHHTRHVAIDVSDSPLENHFEVGQAFGVIPEWELENEYNEVKVRSSDHKLRLYSIGSPGSGEEGEGRILSTPVKRVVEEHWDTHELFLGVCSNYLCDRQPGDTVKVTGPTGRHFLLPDPDERNDHSYVFLATGTGIAPFRGMLMELLEAGVDREIWLILGVPYFTDVLYGEYFRAMDDRHENFHFVEACSRQQTTADGDKMYVQNRLLERPDRFGSLLSREETLVYICGLKGMETGIYRAFMALGCEELLVTVPDGLRGEDLSAISDRDDRLQNVRPDKTRVRVEVY